MSEDATSDNVELRVCAYGWSEGCKYHLPDEWIEWCVPCLQRDGKAICTCTCPKPDGDDPGCAFHGRPVVPEPRFCPDGVPPCADCRNGDDLMNDEMCDSCGRCAPATDLSDCPYFRRYAGMEGHDPEGTCSYGCRDEPSCVTDRPLHGWPSEQRAQTGRRPNDA